MNSNVLYPFLFFILSCCLGVYSSCPECSSLLTHPLVSIKSPFLREAFPAQSPFPWIKWIANYHLMVHARAKPRVQAFCPGQVAQLVGALSRTPEGWSFDSQSGNMPGLWIQSLVRVHIEGSWSVFLSLSISLSLPLSLKSSGEDKKKKECKFSDSQNFLSLFTRFV